MLCHSYFLELQTDQYIEGRLLCVQQHHYQYLVYP